jgi:hypothetical protein
LAFLVLAAYCRLLPSKEQVAFRYLYLQSIFERTT